MGAFRLKSDRLCSLGGCSRLAGTMPSNLPEPGQIVIVRQRPFVVNDIKPSALPLAATAVDGGGRQHLLRLSSVEDEGLGEELSIVWELEPGVSCRERAQAPELKDFSHQGFRRLLVALFEFGFNAAARKTTDASGGGNRGGAGPRQPEVVPAICCQMKC